jgi:hypothetical protein
MTDEIKKTDDEFVDAETVRKYIGQAIEHYHASIRRFEANLKPGYRRRRSGYDQLNEKGLLKVDFIFDEYLLVLRKQSALPAGMRRVIKDLGDEALMLHLADKKRREEAAKKQETK